MLQLTAVATSSDPRSQKQLLELCKGVTESILQLLNSIKSGSTDSSITEKAKIASDHIKNLVSTVKLGVVGARDCDEAAKAIMSAIKTLDSPPETSIKSFKQCKDEMTSASKAAAAAINNIIAAAKNNIAELGLASRAVAETISQVISATRNAIAATPSAEVKQALHVSASNVAGAAREVITNAKILASDPTSSSSQKKLANSQASMNDTVSKLLACMATGELHTEDAMDEIRATIGALDAAGLYASAGQLEPEYAVESLEDCQNRLRESCKALEESAQQLASASKGASEQLGTSAKKLSSVLNKLTSSTKTTAAMMVDVNSQQKILIATKAAALASHQLIVSARDAQIKGNDSKSQESVAAAISGISGTTDSLLLLTSGSYSP